MQPDLWKDLVLSPVENDLWELFHENSKVEKHRRWLNRDRAIDAKVRALARSFHESLPYDGYPKIDLPASLSPLPVNLGEAILNRSSALSLAPASITLQNLAALLQYSYGITRPNVPAAFPRQFRAVPSAGGLYPLEVFFHNTSVEDIGQGLFHYHPTENAVRLLIKGNHTDRLATAMAQSELANGASLVVFLTAVFERSVVKYGERGYRFTLLEAGHVAQNLCLLSSAMGLGCVTIGGFVDRIIDDFLGLDGLTQSTIYVIAIGHNHSLTEYTATQESRHGH